MTTVFLTDAYLEERSALRLMLKDLKMKVIGEASDLSTALTLPSMPASDMILVDENSLPKGNMAALVELRTICPKAIVVVLVNQFDVKMQSAISLLVDAFVSKGEMPDRLAERLVDAAGKNRMVGFHDVFSAPG
jgi:DNA-binding NarL/FixJ family response regulator